MTTAVAALVRERGGSVALADVTLPAPAAGELLVQVMASGVCPTDLFGIDGGAGDRFPAVFGHEGAGIVTAVGDEVEGFAPGDHVVLSFASCGRCASCADGHPASCARFAALNYAARGGASTTDGEAVTTGWMSQSSWASHVLVPASSAAPIDDDVPWAVAAPLGCGILTGAGTVLNVLRPAPGDAVLVLGAGTTGLAAVMAARHRGVERIVVSDPVAARRALALELGASAAHDPGELAAALGRDPGFTHAVDTVGTQETTDAALAALAPRGVAATVALKPGANPVSVSQTRLLWGRTLVGVIEGDAVVARDVPALAALWRAGRLPVERLVTPYPFPAVDAAVADTRAGRAIKAVLVLDAAAADTGTAAATTLTAADLETPADAGGRAGTAAPIPASAPTGAATAAHGRAAASVPRPAGSLVDALRAGAVPDDDLPLLWRTLPAVPTAALRGLWHGWGVSRDHRAGRLLERSRWYGKLFRADDDVAPIVCEGDDGGLVADVRLARGGASLRTIAHDGVATASMVYDGQPIIDHFVRLSPDALLGVMTGRDAADRGRLYYFVLEKGEDLPVATGDTPHST